MDFAEAWDALSIGDAAAVSNGKPPPSSNTDGVPYKAWRSHNFEGTLVEKIPGPFQKMRFELAAQGRTVVSYTIGEGVGHTITPA